MITPEQCIAARELLGWTQQQLADAVAIGVTTIMQFELGRRRMSRNNTIALQATFEMAGVVFDGGPGVRLRG